MQIVIAMSGFGERFRRAGYTVPKPLIQVDGKSIIEHVIDMFPGEERFVFVCNQGHLDQPEYRMREIIERACPTGIIVGIPPHKLGPVHAVIQVEEFLDPNEPTILNYCDFTCYWDYLDFKSFVSETDCDGAIPCYRGFHPHMLGSTNYAYVREVDGWVIAIQEKKSYTDTPMQEYASSGTYYFRSGALAIDYCRRSMQPDLALNGEYYISLVYRPMLEDGLAIAVFALPHFMQWGTPTDLADYQAVSQAFRYLVERPQRSPRHSGTIMVPMAGLGSRFAVEAYSLPKPLIPVSGRPMVVQAAMDLPVADRYIFVVRQDMPRLLEVSDVLLKAFDNSSIVTLGELTDGQARTCMLALDKVPMDQPLTIGSCDNGALYDADKFDQLMADPNVDVLVWVARGYPGAVRSPSMYGWADAQEGRVKAISVKTPLSHPETDPVILGTFTFKRALDFQKSAERMFAREARINGEFYVDTCINDAVALGLNVQLFEVDSYLCWGTPADLKRFNYWQSCFHKWNHHSYRLELDGDIPPDAIDDLIITTRVAPMPLPGPRP